MAPERLFANGSTRVDRSVVRIKDYWRILRERWFIVASVTSAVLLASGVMWWVQPPEYTARLTLYVSAQTADTPNAAYQGGLLSQQRVSSYVELIGRPRVSQEVVRDLGLPDSPEAVAGRIRASSAPDSVLIDIAVVDRSPAGAAAIANAVGAVFTNLVAEIEQPSVPGAAAPVVARVVQPATAPATSSSTSLPMSLALGAVVGLAAGAGLALLRNALDTTVKSPGALREATGAPNLGTITFDAEVPRRPLTVHEDPHSPRAEAFRQLRTSLRFVDVDHPRKVVLVTSALPGEGKTTSLCNLAIAVAAAETRVLVVEADLRRPTIADLLGIERAAGLTDVLTGRAQSQQVIQCWGGVIDVLSSGPLPPNPSELLASRQMTALLEELRDRYDMVLLDSPPLLPVTDAAAVAPATDGAILVCRFNETTREQIGRAAEALRAVSAPLLGTVFTMVPDSGPRAYAQYNSYYPTQVADAGPRRDAGVAWYPTRPGHPT
jgi:non-specific protein-tyrosine kinase